jgi:hypothetical protein
MKFSLRTLILWILALGLLGFLSGLAVVQYSPQENLSIQALPPAVAVEEVILDNASTDNMTAAAEVTAEGPAQETRSQLVERGEMLWDVAPPEEAHLPSEEEWITLMVQNKSRLDLIEVPDTSKDWEAAREGRKLKIQFRSEVDAMQDILSRRNRGKYAVQMLSLPEEQFEVALERVRLLMQDGHYAYLHRTEKPYKGKLWFRVRVGFFKNTDEARAAGQEIYEAYRKRQLFPANFWPVLPSPGEQSRELLDLRQATNKPWVVQPPEYESFEAAAKDLARFSSETELSYLSMRLDSDGKPVYRIRVGFFEQSSEASYIRTLLRRSYSAFQQARIMSL